MITYIQNLFIVLFYLLSMLIVGLTITYPISADVPRAKLDLYDKCVKSVVKNRGDYITVTTCYPASKPTKLGKKPYKARWKTKRVK